MQGSPIDWEIVSDESKHGRMLDVLLKLPRERWKEKNYEGATLLHFACFGHNVAAVMALVQNGLNVNVRDHIGYTPAHYAAIYKTPRVLTVLCILGSDLRERTCHNQSGFTPIDFALFSTQRQSETQRILIANGVRLSTAHEGRRSLITPELEAFERGVLRCRAAVVAMLRVKRAGPLWMWDKFLLKEIAICVWATRYNDNWQKC